MTQPALSRSQRLCQSLEAAFGGHRAIALTGHSSDLLVAENGALVPIPEYLALFSAARQAATVVVDRRYGAQALRPPGCDHAGSTVALPSSSVIDLLQQLRSSLTNHPGPTTVIVDWACLEIDADDGDLLRTLLELPADPAFSDAGHHLVLVFRTDPPPRQLTVMPGWAIIAVGLPDAAERRHVLGRTHQRCPVPLEPGLDIDAVAVTLGGSDSDGLLRTANEARNGKPLTTARIVEIKSTELERTSAGTLSVYRGPYPNGLAGMASLRLHVQQRQAARRPIGPLLLAGPPGIGKTFSAAWVAQTLGLPLVEFGQILGGIVGESERNFEAARAALEANGPAVVLLDEADMIGLGRRTTNLDAGVSDRLRAGTFKLLNDSARTGNTYLLCTNDPSRIDPAGLDRTRVIPCLHPTPQECVQIMALAAQREGWNLDTDAAAASMANSTELWTGRQLVRLLEDAACAAAAAGRPAYITGEDLQARIATGINLTDPGAAEYMALTALTLADNQEAFPWVAAAALGEHATLPAYLQPLVDQDRQLIMSRVHDRIHQLRQAGHGFHN